LIRPTRTTQFLDRVVDRIGDGTGDVLGDRRGHRQITVGKVAQFVHQAQDRFLVLAVDGLGLALCRSAACAQPAACFSVR
jgi:uncharacterized protein YjbJ (UPF0337 family)